MVFFLLQRHLYLRTLRPWTIWRKTSVSFITCANSRFDSRRVATLTCLQLARPTYPCKYSNTAPYIHTPREVYLRMMFRFLQLSLSQPCVRHAILGLAAFHLSWLTKSIELDFAGYEYRRSAYAELRKAVQSFSKENADAILAASIMLCWQAPDT